MFLHDEQKKKNLISDFFSMERNSKQNLQTRFDFPPWNFMSNLSFHAKGCMAFVLVKSIWLLLQIAVMLWLNADRKYHQNKK